MKRKLPDILEKEKDFYYDKKGLLVLTERFLKKRGFCCGSGCRNCPYPSASLRTSKQKSNLKFKI